MTRMAAGGVRYDATGHRCTEDRRADPRIAASIHTELGDARTLVTAGVEGPPAAAGVRPLADTTREARWRS